MRNLGSGTPVDLYSSNGSSITVPYLDESSTRPRVRYGELGTHKSDESESELYKGDLLIQTSGLGIILMLMAIMLML